MNRIFLISLFSLLTCFACESGDYSIEERKVDSAGGVIEFHEEGANEGDSLIVGLSFPPNSVSTQISPEFFRIKLEDFLFANDLAFYPLTDIIYFLPDSIEFNEPLEVEMSYREITIYDNVYKEVSQNNLLYGSQHMFNIYRIPDKRAPLDSLLNFENWEKVEGIVLDSINSRVKFSVSDFNGAYIFAYPETRRNDIIICEVLDHDNLSYFMDNTHTNNSYPGVDVGFVHINNRSYYDIFSRKSTYLHELTTVIEFYIRHDGSGPGVYSGFDITVSVWTSFWEGDDRYNVAAEQTDETSIEIYEMGGVGEKVSGRISGKLYEFAYDTLINVNIPFEVIRTR
jgi:hypothetical protein